MKALFIIIAFFALWIGFKLMIWASLLVFKLLKWMFRI